METITMPRIIAKKTLRVLVGFCKNRIIFLELHLEPLNVDRKTLRAEFVIINQREARLPVRLKTFPDSNSRASSPPPARKPVFGMKDSASSASPEAARTPNSSLSTNALWRKFPTISPGRKRHQSLKPSSLRRTHCGNRL